VRYYTTKTNHGDTTFKCVFCQHSVSTSEFDSLNGNRRTQAAAAMNQHAALLHVHTWTPNKQVSRGAL
jgi:hypothetical protein